MFDILLRGGWSVEEEQEFQADRDRRQAEVHILEDWERRIEDGSYRKEVGWTLESGEDFEHGRGGH